MADKNIVNVGRRLLVTVVDDLAQRVPDRIFGIIPNGLEVSDGFRNVTMKELAHAINYTSWWIEKELGRSSKFETLSYMAANDIRYIVFILACNKTGYKPLLPSSRNSDEAFLSLLKATDCSKFVYSSERKQRVMDIKRLRPDLQLTEVPSLTDMLESNSVLYPFNKTYEDVEDDVALAIHSSGTTGLPKPIFLTHGFIGVFDSVAYLRHPPGRQSSFHTLKPHDLILSTTPFFHPMGYFLLMQSILYNIRFVVGPDKPLSSDFLVDVMNATNPTAALIPPSVLEEMSQSNRALEALARLRYLYFGGAPLSPEVGDTLCNLTNLITVIGSSEVGYIPTMAPLERENWQYFEWNPFHGVDMQPVDDHVYELVIQRGENRDFHGIFHTFPDLQEYRTKDVFTPHPTKPNLWKYHGRLDDIIVLSNGEKFNPVPMEKIIEGHPLVARATIVGQGRFQAALLVEPNWSQWNEDKPDSVLINEIWPVVQQANQVGFAHGRVLKTKIRVASKAKPFKTTVKGTSQRRHINKDYEEEINAIYAKNDEEYVGKLPEKVDLAGIKEYVRQVVLSILDTPGLSDRDDFFTAGLDSLQTIHLSKILQGAVHSRYPEKNYGVISTQEIYSNPTVEQLSGFVNMIINGRANNQGEKGSRSEKIDSLAEKYTVDLPKRDIGVRSILDTHTVILTGSTGSLGNYILNALLNDPKVVKIYCLNRSADAESRQKKTFSDKGLTFDSDVQARVEFLKASFGEEKLGLDGRKYDEMARTVDAIIHNAWKVDFNHSVASFDDVHIRGVRRFVDFSLKSTRHSHIYFISSIGSIGGWKPTKHGPVVPEIPLEDSEVTLPQGYGESKHVGERICFAASRHAGVPTTILRVGQIGGPTTEKGLWNRQEWLPTIIATSKVTGKIPSALGSTPVNWIPVDTLATIILELMQTRRTTEPETRCAVFHLLNPSTAPWGSLIPTVQKHYTVKPVELSAWVDDLERIKNPSEAEVAAKPALKLLDFYRGLLRGDGHPSASIELEKTKAASVTVRTLGPIGEDLMENWLTQWAF